MRSSPGGNALSVALVVPRFGEEVVGGAELHARSLMERLGAAGHRVEILTTCAVDHHSWRNVLPPGVERRGDLVVRRFLADQRDVGLHGEIERAISLGLPLSAQEELLWLRHGVSSSRMEEEIERSAHRYDVVLAMPYLFGTTYFAMRAAGDRAVLIPCLHDEAYAYLGVVREMLDSVRGVMFNARAEATFGRSLAPGVSRWAVVGMGFDDPVPQDGAAFRRGHRLTEPVLLYVGRREGGKNTPLLVEYFTRFKHRCPESNLTLAFVGSGDPLPSRPDIRDLRPDWSQRDAMYRSCTIFTQPSVNESLSIVLMQAWLAGRPVVVHGRSAVTRDHAVQSNGGLWFNSYVEFEEVLLRLLADDALRTALGRKGRAYVLSEYSWPAVLDRFSAALSSWLDAETPRDAARA